MGPPFGRPTWPEPNQEIASDYLERAGRSVPFRIVTSKERT